MDFSFIHTADLHLGSPFLGLSSDDPELAKIVASASRDAFEDLVSEAIDRKVRFMVISGDVYDGDWRDTTIAHFFNRQMGRLQRAGIPVFKVKGNHDAESVITGSMTLPDSVQIFPSRKATTFRIDDLKVAIHGQSFANRAVSENLALSYPAAQSAWFNIGVLHTSCEGRAGHDSYAPCELAHLLQRGYQYWALGHIHAFEVLNTTPPVIFPGNLQGRHVGECGPKGAIIVDVCDGEVQAFKRILLDRIRWAVIEVDLTALTTSTEAFAKIQQAIQEQVHAAGETPLVFRMVLRGSTPLNRAIRADTRQIEDEVKAAAGHCADLIWLEGLKIATSEPAVLTVHAGSALANIDFGTFLDSLTGSPDLLRQAREELDVIKGKLPAMPIPDDLFSDEAIARIVEDARELLIASSTGEEKQA